MARILTFGELLRMTEKQREFLSAHAFGHVITDTSVRYAQCAGYDCGFDYRDENGILRHDTTR